MSLLDQLAADAVNIFLTDFAESVVYTPFGGEPVTILAVIDRERGKQFGDLRGSGGYTHEVSIANDATAGVTSINKGKDHIAFANRVGGTVESFVVADVLRNDQGMWHLAVG